MRQQFEAYGEVSGFISSFRHVTAKLCRSQAVSGPRVVTAWMAAPLVGIGRADDLTRGLHTPCLMLRYTHIPATHVQPQVSAPVQKAISMSWPSVLNRPRGSVFRHAAQRREGRRFLSIDSRSTPSSIVINQPTLANMELLTTPHQRSGQVISYTYYTSRWVSHYGVSWRRLRHDAIDAILLLDIPTIRVHRSQADE